jgi:hypothetical protein
MLGIYKSAAYLLLLSALWSMSQAAWSQSDDEAMTQAKEVLRTAPIVDGHNDLP